MKAKTPTLSLLDTVISQLDVGLKKLLKPQMHAARPSPANNVERPSLTPHERKHSGALMRINHVGEICAQALYQGQALTARSSKVREQMQHAADEEVDHLAWCAERIDELGSHTSYLNPVWYTGSLTIGIVAGMVGDRWNLGFVAETEKQVVRHLDGHLDSLPENDVASRKVVEQMRIDELQHATSAIDAGAAELPQPVKAAMRVMSKVMTTLAYWV